MRVRISFDALRLCLLVAAGVTSGYLWRAAFESSAPAEQRLAAGPGIVQKSPAPRVVRIAPHHSTKSRPVAKHHAARLVVARVTHSSAPAVTSTHVASSPPPAATPTSRPPKSTPKPTPKPSPPPPTTTTTPPPAETSTPVAAPVQQVVAPPPTTTPPVTAPGDDDSRPGNGNGDKNHEHTGPGGKDKGK